MDHAAVTAQTVIKVILVAAAGGAVSPAFVGGKPSQKNLGTITTQIMLPALITESLTNTLDSDVFARVWFLILFSSSTVFIGYLCSVLMTKRVPKDYVALMTLGCCFPNVLSLPLSTLQSLSGVPWFTREEYERSVTYVFVYNFGISTLMWSIGNAVVLKQKQKLLLSSPTTAADNGKPGEGSANKPVGLQQPSNLADEGRASRKPRILRLYGFITTYINPPLMASFVGAGIGLVRPLKFTFTQGVLATFTQALTLIGDGCVPLTLLLLGVNLVGGKRSGDKVFVPKKVMAVCAVTRLIIIPAVSFAAVAVLAAIGVLPDDKTTTLVILLNSAMPTAINTSIICAYHSFMVTEISAMLFPIYLASIGTISFWLFVALAYLS